MAIHGQIARGSQANVFKNFAQGASLGNQLKNRNTLVNEQVNKNAISNKRNKQVIKEENRKNTYAITQAIMQEQDPEQQRLMLVDNIGILAEDDQDAQELQRIASSPANTFSDSIMRLNKATKPPNALSEYGDINFYNKGGKTVGYQLDQRGNRRDIPGIGPVPDAGKETYGDFQEIPGYPGAFGQPGKQTNKYANVKAPGKDNKLKITPSDEALIGRSVASLFDGLYDISTGTFRLRDDKDRKLAKSIKSRATRIFLDALKSGKDITLEESASQAAQEFGISLPGPNEPTAPPNSNPGIKFIGFE